MSSCACGCGSDLDGAYSNLGYVNKCYQRLLRAGELPPKVCLECPAEIGRRAERCEACRRDRTLREAKRRSREFRESDPITWHKRRFRNHYGVDLDAARVTYDQQGGLCAICLKEIKFETGSPEDVYEKAAFDHDHVTGKPRGWLCRGCNLGLGHFRDDQDSLRRAVAYLRRHQG